MVCSVHTGGGVVDHGGLEINELLYGPGHEAARHSIADNAIARRYLHIVDVLLGTVGH